MANASRKISAKEVIADIRAGKSHEALMEKYHLTESQLQALFAKLVKNGLIQEFELNGSKFNQEETTGAVRARNFSAPLPPGLGERGLDRPGIADDIRSERDDLSLLQKCDLSPSMLNALKESSSPLGNSPQGSVPAENSALSNQESVHLDEKQQKASFVSNSMEMIKAHLFAPAKFQPDRPDILINTDWGVPMDVISHEDAAAKDLILCGSRWVTSAERDTLRKQAWAYRLLRGAGLLVFLLGMFFSGLLILASLIMWGRGDFEGTSQAGKIIISLTILYFCVAIPREGWQIWRLKPKARRFFVLLCVLPVVLGIAIAVRSITNGEYLGFVGSIALITPFLGMICLLSSKTVRLIFNPPISGHLGPAPSRIHGSQKEND